MLHYTLLLSRGQLYGLPIDCLCVIYAIQKRSPVDHVLVALMEGFAQGHVDVAQRRLHLADRSITGQYTPIGPSSIPFYS